MAEQLGEIQKRVITVCDRETEIWHYQHYKVSHGQSFVVRAARNRRQEKAHQLPIFQFAQYTQPELLAFIFCQPQPQRFFLAFKIDNQWQEHHLVMTLLSWRTFRTIQSR